MTLYNFLYSQKAVPALKTLAFYATLSWLYAACSQIILHLPFVITPLSLQPAPILLLSILLGRPALYGYLLYLLQGACGAPLFSFFGSGISHLFGPTGGFLIGFAFASAFLVFTNKKSETTLQLLTRLLSANIIVFSCGLSYLSFFVPASSLLYQGLFPFIIGDFLVKPLLIITIKSSCSYLRNR